MKNLLLMVFISRVSDLFAQPPATAPIEKFNPEYHFYPSIDPTGLFYYGGNYYLNWGSAVSNDLVHWKITEFGKNRIRRPGGPPPRPQVLGGISGTVVVDWNNTSGLGKNGNPPLVAFQMSTGSMHVVYSNDTAKTWVRHDKPAVMQNSAGSFRDPKVFWYEPEKKWVMVMPWCEIQEVRFYSSGNLLDWEFTGKFGPWGATNGQWECVDFFPLNVDNDPAKTKWVLLVSVQPRNGQYFVGDFDGEQFRLDREMIGELSYEKYFPVGQMVFDFEQGLDEWIMEGDAFKNNPTTDEGINGRHGSRTIKSDPIGKGKITSPEFAITKNYLTFLIGGGHYAGEEELRLLVDGKVVRTQTGNSGNAHLSWAGWNVSDFRGRNARIEVVDSRSAGSWLEKAYIYCDAIMLADELPKPPYREFNPDWEKTFWVDYGADFFAARAWSNLAPGDDRTVWAGWMGSWKYFNEPVRGSFSTARSLQLKTLPEGIRLIQNPIREMESLRGARRTGEPTTFEGLWVPRKFAPTRNAYELIVEFENISAEEFGLKIGVGGDERTVVGYDPSKEELYVDRTNSGYHDFNDIFPTINTGPLKKRSGITRLHIFVDHCSIEVFANNGETVISSKIYPDPKSLGIELFSKNGKVKVKSLDLWELNPIKLY
jgi:sucrose-6-phosphate hydrolase SacC (GH32 family)